MHQFLKYFSSQRFHIGTICGCELKGLDSLAFVVAVQKKKKKKKKKKMGRRRGRNYAFLFEVKISTLFTVLTKFGFHMHPSSAHEIRNATSTGGIFSDL